MNEKELDRIHYDLLCTEGLLRGERRQLVDRLIAEIRSGWKVKEKLSRIIEVCDKDTGDTDGEAISKIRTIAEAK